ncbi:stealth family protein [Galbitalea soli]|uniref:Sugar phosphotransferase n=1 Tax=Galbitalea soli TaxID=1268042 RepID=A0A7C9TP95_9MICO|nr:stealth family protein [Galbitalea soli]NEM90395.1 sugar phosphotransferase [Galbitalea soli]NYJ31106.1 hypothetical protein [Galbitalea soli]
MTADSVARRLRLLDTPPGRRVAERDDVVLRKGRFTLVHHGVTPQRAAQEDFLAVADALRSAGIEFLLVHDDAGRHILAVDAAERDAVTAALVSAFAAEPFYAKSAKGGTVLVAEGALAAAGAPRIVTLYRPRVDASGRLRYGSSLGVRLELWEFGADEIVAPAPNAMMRQWMPREEAIEATTELYGREWPTLAGMFEPLAGDITFDIDIVFSWVDGSSAEFQRARAQRMKSYVVGDGDDSEARYRQLDELKYALRSVYLYAPWIRHIYIVTDSPTPDWLDEHPDVTIVPSSAFFRDPANLPTHNSHAIEAQLQHIDGLSEHFLYSNDDMFFARPVNPDMFFSPGGVTKFIEAQTRIGLGENNPARSGFENAARVNRALLRSRFGRVTTRHLEHAPTPLRKSVLLEMEKEFAAEFDRTAASPFRSATDISVTNSLYHYYALMTGRAVVQTNARVKYVETTLAASIDQMARLLRRRSEDFFCLNDGSKPEISVETRQRAVLEFLNRYFPIPAPWETQESIDESGSDAVSAERESASS